MGCRAQFWSLLGGLALIYLCGGLMWVVGGASSVTTKEAGASISATMKAQGQKIDSETVKASQGIAAGAVTVVGLPFFACTGLPVLFFCGLMANANRRGLRQQRQHEEQLATQKQQFEAMQQSAMAHTAQAQMNYAQMQAQQPPPMSIPANAPSTDVKAQFEAAKALIDAKQFSAARNLLKTINHPMAKEWIAKIEGK
jgi:hypothetical protein